MVSTAGSPFLAHVRLAELARVRGDQPFVLEALPDGSQLSYRELHDRSARLAAVLRDRGVVRGERVITQLGNRWESLAAFFAASMLGAVLVPISPTASLDDLASAIEQTQPTVGLLRGECPDCAALASEMGLDPASILVLDADPGGGLSSLTEAIDEAVPLGDPEPGQVTDLIAVLYKSGTSGWPNGVMFTQANLRFAGVTYAAATRLQPTDRVLISFPVSHIAALGNMVMATLWSGASLGFSVGGQAWIDAAVRQQTTVANVSAVDVHELLSLPPSSHSPQHLRLVVFGPPVPTEVRQRFEQRFNTELRLGYGMTEAVAPISLSMPTVTPDDDCVGEALLPHALLVVDADGAPVPHGQPGELVVLGVPGLTLAAGYYQRPKLTQEVFGSGSLHTGDQVILERDGRLRFLARKSETLKIGLPSISTVEIERVLKEHVGVADAAVVAIPTEDGAEVVTAFVVLSEYHPDVEVGELAAWAETRLAEDSLPGAYRLVEALPYSELGKVLKSRLAKMTS